MTRHHSDASHHTRTPPASILPTCPISRDTLTDPITLPCGHTFNQDAISQWFEHSSPTCPACQTRVSGGVPLRVNYVLKDLIEALSDWVGSAGIAPPASLSLTQWKAYGKDPADLLPRGSSHSLIHEIYMQERITEQELRKLRESRAYRLWKLRYNAKKWARVAWDSVIMMLICAVLCLIAWLVGSVVAHSLHDINQNVQQRKMERLQRVLWDCTPFETWRSERLMEWEPLQQNAPELAAYIQREQINGAQLAELDVHALSGLGIKNPLKQKTLLKAIRTQMGTLNSNQCANVYHDPSLRSFDTMKQISTFVDLPRLELLYRWLFKPHQVRAVLGIPRDSNEPTPIVPLVSFLLCPRLTSLALIVLWKPTMWIFYIVLQLSFLLPDFVFWMDAFIFLPRGFWRNIFLRLALRVMLFNMPFIGGYTFVLRFSIMSVLSGVQLYFQIKYLLRALEIGVQERSIRTFFDSLYTQYKARNHGQEHVF